MPNSQKPERVTRDYMREQTRELGIRILEAATDLFSRKGFLGTSTQEIADAVGLIKGTLYYHIGNKEDLLYQIHHQVVVEGIRRWTPIVERGQDDTRVLLRVMILEHCQVIDRYRDAVAVFIEESKFLSPKLAIAAVEERDQYQELLTRIIERGVARGELESKNPKLAALCLMSMMNSTYRWYHPGGTLGPDQLAQSIALLALEGMSVKSP
jgi:AcrR family transcriptional regulator